MRYLQRFIFAHLMLIMIISDLNSKAHAQAPECQELSLNSCSVLPSSTYKAFCKFPDGAVYEGDMDCNGFITGQGEIRNKDGSTYAGSWRQGLFHGYGIYETNGDIYRGDFFQGSFTGNGKIQFSNGNVESGKFLDWRLDGKGEVVFPGVGYMRGNFKKGQLHGQGVLEGNDEKYSGNFKNGKLIEGVTRTREAGVIIEREGGFQNERLQGHGIVRNFDDSGSLRSTTIGNFAGGFLEGSFTSKTYEAGELLFTEVGVSKRGVTYGSLKRTYQDGTYDDVEIKDGLNQKTTSYLADGSVFFSEIDENKWLVNSYWITRPAKFLFDEFYVDVLTFKTKTEARRALATLEKGVSLKTAAQEMGTFVRKFIMSDAYYTDSAYWRNLSKQLKTATAGDLIPDVHCQNALSGCDVIVLRETKLAKAPPKAKTDIAPELAGKEKRNKQDKTLVQAASGSGFFITNYGVTVTNSHVIDSCKTVTINVNGKELVGTVLADDKVNDVAVLKFELKTDAYLSLAKENGQLMDEIYVAGFPFGDAISSSLKVTKGIVSSVSGIGNNFSQMQIDAALQPGNSGGPVVNQNGNVIGIAVAKLDFKQVLKNFGTLPEDTNFAVKLSVLQSILSGLNIKVTKTDTKKTDSRALGKSLTESTVNLACYMSKKQLNELQTVRAIIRAE